MKSLLGFILLLSIAAHAAPPKKDPAQASVPAAKPSGPVQGPPIPLTQEKRGEYLIWTLLNGKDSAMMASYFDDSVKSSLTKDAVQHFRSQITWLSKLTGDNLEQLMTRNPSRFDRTSHPVFQGVRARERHQRSARP